MNRSKSNSRKMVVLYLQHMQRICTFTSVLFMLLAYSIRRYGFLTLPTDAPDDQDDPWLPWLSAWQTKQSTSVEAVQPNLFMSAVENLFNFVDAVFDSILSASQHSWRLLAMDCILTPPGVYLLICMVSAVALVSVLYHRGHPGSSLVLTPRGVNWHYHWSVKRIVFTMLFLAMLASLPWEFVRLYQSEVAKRATILFQGMPADCLPNEMSYWQSVKAWLLWQLSWEDTPCEKYHEALLVNPIWEITPILVLVSALTRGIVTPLHIVCSAVGRSARLLFREVPLLWQPLLFILIGVMLVMSMFALCYGRRPMPTPFSLPLIARRRHMDPKPSRLTRDYSCQGDRRIDPIVIDSSMDSSRNESF